MKLLYAVPSPFARKAVILAHELDTDGEIALTPSGAITPVSNNDSVNTVNPLGMIPALVTNDGQHLFDSTVICEYINDHFNGPFYPSLTAEKYRALKLQSLSDGIMDLLVAIRYETALRPAELQWPTYIEHQFEKVERGLAALEADVPQFSEDFTIGEVAVVCALGYLDFRYPTHDWRTPNPQLSAWFTAVQPRDSIQRTIPS